MTRRIGIDFDNTIVCYDELFHRVALEQALIPAELTASKSAVRDYLRAAGLEDRWTAMQGCVYGERMIEARAFPGVLEFIALLVRARVPTFIVSHKTKHPYMGPKYDLHHSARTWLERNGAFDPCGIGLSPHQVYFELTKQAKLQRIADLRCTHFIDDLPELLSEPEFPSGIVRLLFDPRNDHADSPLYARTPSWQGISNELLAA